ncbi:TetR/AcrR family transcriptional regulator [Paenibacillus sp. sgz500958]|uniref:TetR/AcrR family transcriptional regulator n=1 Tax=Paenibacillus sp. sgz500958 TaxID=3242475 RepID=UPI0036D290B1
MRPTRSTPSEEGSGLPTAGLTKGRRKQPEKDLYRERILEASRQLFSEHGLGSVSMYQIAKKAGIGQGSLYRRYADKGEICSDLLSSSSKHFLSELEEEVVHPSTSNDTLMRLRLCIEKVIDYIDQHADLLHLIKSEFTGKHQLTQFEHPIFQRLHVIIAELLKQAAASGEIIPMDAHFTATALIAALSPDLFLYHQKAYGSTKEQILQGTLTIFVTGLKKLQP